MKEIKSVKEYRESKNCYYVLKLTPFEFFLIKRSLSFMIDNSKLNLMYNDFKDYYNFILSKTDRLYKDFTDIPF